MTALRMTKPRLEFLVLINRYNGHAWNAQGRLRPQLAKSLGYASTPATLRRIITDLEAEGMITTTVKGGRLYEVRLEPPGLGILENRGLVPDTPRRYLLDPNHYERRGHIIALISSAIANLQRYGRSGNIPDDPGQARLEANYALHADLTPQLPTPEQLSLEIATCRSTITALGDAYLQSADSLNPQALDDAVTQLTELRLTLIAARFAVENPLPDL